MQVQEEPLKQVVEVEIPVTGTLDNLDLVVESFHKAAGISLDEVIGDLIESLVHGGGGQECIESVLPADNKDR